MLWLRIVATVFMGISCMTCLVKNIHLYSNTQKPSENDTIEVAISTIYGWLWRAFIIFAIWKI